MSGPAVKTAGETARETAVDTAADAAAPAPFAMLGDPGAMVCEGDVCFVPTDASAGIA